MSVVHTPLVHTPRRLIVLLAALVAFGPLSIDMYLPSLPLIAADLGASEQQVQLTIGVFLAGFSLGMLFYGPLSIASVGVACCLPVSCCTCWPPWVARWPAHPRGADDRLAPGAGPGWCRRLGAGPGDCARSVPAR